MTLTANDEVDCLLTLTTDDHSVQQATDARIFDPQKKRDRQKEDELAQSLATTIGLDNEEFKTLFSWTVLEVQTRLQSHRGLVHEFNPEFNVKTYQPPNWTVERLDKEARWAEIEARYAEWVERDTLELWEDDPGTGKTTSTAKGAAASGRSHVFYLPTHENCREFLDDDEKPDGYFHLKGASQHQHRCCADAEQEGKTCSKHPEHPVMCPIFDLPEDHPLQEAYNWIAAEKGGKTAHRELELFDKDWHDDEACKWLDQFDELKMADRVVTVHAYLGHGLLDDFEDHIIDDLQNIPTDQRSLTTAKIERVQDVLSELAQDGHSAIPQVYQSLYDVAGGLVTSLEDRHETFDAIPPAEFDVPSYIEQRCVRNHDMDAESLAWAKHGYMEYLHSSIATKDTTGLPSTIDFLLIVAGFADGGVTIESARRAIEAQTFVNICPRCEAMLEKSGTENIHDWKQTVSGPWHTCGDCGWSEQTDPLTTPEISQARCTAWLSVPSKKDSDDRGRSPTLEYTRIRRPTELPPPENILILDATPTPAVYAHLFDIDESVIHRAGTDQIDLNADIIQIVNGQYPRSTICETKHDGAGNRRREKIQTVIDDICERKENVILVGHKRARKYFDVPVNADWIDFYAGRGLDRPSADALVVIGAPFPNERSLSRIAEALTVDEDIELGQVIHDEEDYQGERDLETRRPYWYVDAEENGYSVKVKPRYGLVGELFTDRVERELIQMLHRIRPVLPETRKEIYLLTNVPLPVPVTALTTLEELTAVANSEPVEILGPKAQEIVSLLTPWFGSFPRRRGFSDAWNVTEEEITATVNDIYDLYRKELGETSKPSIQNGLDELREHGVISRSDKRRGRLGYVYTFPRSACVPLEYVITQSGKLSLPARQRLQTCISSSNEDDTGTWIRTASNIVSNDSSKELS